MTIELSYGNKISKKAWLFTNTVNFSESKTSIRSHHEKPNWWKYFSNYYSTFEEKVERESKDNSIDLEAINAVKNRVLFKKEESGEIFIDHGEAEVVKAALSMLQKDLKSVFDAALDINSKEPRHAKVIVGTVGNSEVISELEEKGLVDLSTVRGQWEAYLIKNINWQGEEVLVIAGSDSRGTAYGVLELSRIIGVSPWVWWADVVPEQQDVFEIPENLFITDAPKVKFRGVFLNDEDWGLQPWAAKTFEPETGDIGPKTYEKIFQLLLRMKANTIWPAMHPSTKAFYTIPGNQAMAAKYQIHIGTSHAEPMLRNNVDEWDHKRYGEYNYASNKEMVKQYWQDRVSELKEDDRYIVTLGMRGIHDSGMQGDFTTEERVKMLENIIGDQRKMLKNTLNKDITDIPQAFVPYKEVLEIYSEGAKVPEDVTLVWPDDNHGYIRQLSNKAERMRSGGAGVYYHISYWGRPHDFLWLESVPVSLIWEEMNKAYHTNAKDIWIVNVGDIKPNEIGLSFFLEMAWNPSQFSPESLNTYYTHFAIEQFGETHGHEIGEILSHYFQLGFSRKPEHMGWTSVYPNTDIQDPELSMFNNGDEVQQRLDAYIQLEQQVEALQNKIPENLKDAFYQLVGYKVLGAANMNKKLLYAYKSRVYAGQGRNSANIYAKKSKQAFEKIKEITESYNQLNGGKWSYMMTDNPRKLPVYGMPETGAELNHSEKIGGGIIPEGFTEAVKPDTEVALPGFVSSTDREYFIDIFSSGQEAISWTALSNDPWIQISAQEGKTTTEDRIWVSVDWSLFPKNQHRTSFIELDLSGDTYKVQVNAKQLDITGNQAIFVEDNGTVSIEAEHFSGLQNITGAEWKIIQGLGRQNDAVGTFPVSAIPLPIEKKQVPTLSYQFISPSSGKVKLRVHCLPSQPINEDYGLRFLVSIDGADPILMDASLKEAMDEHNGEWKTNVLRAVNFVETEISLPNTGMHTLEITMVDPGVVIDKMEIIINDEPVTYFGARETRNQ